MEVVVQMRLSWRGHQTFADAPKNLYVLWSEFDSGVGGNKPTRLFTVSERGKLRFMYCLRKIVWDTIEALGKRGLASDVAHDQIYSECGDQNIKVNDVIKILKYFRQVGNASLVSSYVCLMEP